MVSDCVIQIVYLVRAKGTFITDYATGISLSSDEISWFTLRGNIQSRDLKSLAGMVFTVINRKEVPNGVIDETTSET